MSQTNQQNVPAIFMLGLVTGAAITALMTPRRGKELRDTLKNSMETMKDTVQEKAEKMKDSASDVVDHGKDIMHRGKKNLRKELDEYNDAA